MRNNSTPCIIAWSVSTFSVRLRMKATVYFFTDRGHPKTEMEIQKQSSEHEASGGSSERQKFV